MVMLWSVLPRPPGPFVASFAAFAAAAFAAVAAVALLTPGGEKLVPLVERYLSHVSPPQHR